MVPRVAVRGDPGGSVGGARAHGPTLVPPLAAPTSTVVVLEGREKFYGT